ncbi:MAG: tetratricopeptide repeat protein [bacterium]|nr:tetratricopeptide repeat protein [bacterium]
MKSRHIWFSIFAVLLFGFLLSRGYGDAGFLMRQGNYYFNGGAYDLEKAERAFQRAVRIEPGILWGHYQLARIYFVKGDSAKATEEINKELEANPENLRSLYVRGLIYGFGKNFVSAEEDFRLFTLWAPKEWAGYNDLAWILAREGKYEETKNVLISALAKVPKAESNPWLFNSLGVAYLNLKDYKNARAHLEKAMAAMAKLTLRGWQNAYPGNDPKSAEEGMAAFREAIKENLRRARGVDNGV